MKQLNTCILLCMMLAEAIKGLELKQNTHNASYVK